MFPNAIKKNIGIRHKILEYFKNSSTFVVCFLLGNNQASGFYMPTFRNTLSIPSS